MTEIIDYEAHKQQKKRTGKERRERSESQFDLAQTVASQHGMTLERHTDVHYTLWGPDRTWQKHIYPGNQRLYAPDRNGPFLSVKNPWTLLDVVKAAVRKKAHAT